MLNFKIIQKWLSRINTSRLGARETIEDPKEITETNIKLNEELDDTRRDRRLQDGIISKNSIQNMQLDRRTLRNDRRFNSDAVYKGKSRRFTIDRRLTSNDRRLEG